MTRARPPGPGRTHGWRWPTSCAPTWPTTLPGAIGLFRDIDSADHLGVPDPLPHPGQGRLAQSRTRLQALAAHRALQPTRPTAPRSCAPTCRPPPVAPVGADGAARAARHPRHAERSGRKLVASRSRPSRPRSPNNLALHADAHIFPPVLATRRHRARRATARRDRRRPRPVPRRSPSLACLAGVATSTRQSGKHKAVTYRWAVNKELRDAVLRLRRRLPPSQPLGRRPVLPKPASRGHDHSHATRILARAWLHSHLALLARPRALRPHPTPRLQQALHSGPA